MRKLQIPYLNETPTSRSMIDAFGGYDHRVRISENSFYEMENLTGDRYPALSPRAKRGKRALPAGVNKVQAMLSGPVLSYIADNKLFIGDKAVMQLGSAGPKRMVGMGAYIVIFPDKMYYNTANAGDHGAMEAESTSSGNLTYRICNGEGEPFGSVFVANEPPEPPQNLQYWLDTSATPSVMKQYSETTGVWNSVLSTTVRIEGAGIGKGFAAGDGVWIDGIPAEAKPLNAFNKKSVILTAAGSDYIALEGIMDEASVQTTNTLTVSRKLPVLDHVFECGNRLWGCRYGENADGAFVNEIYASALGDFKNWTQYRGISTDSYTVSVGAAGEWTGGIAYQGMPHFFKDDVLYRVYGAYPSAYRVEQTACRGVQAGAEKSLQILNERLYYKARNGVCVYDGAYPTEISEVFGEVRYGGSVTAGAADNKYYISMRSDDDGRYHLFKFDSVLGGWFREDNTEAAQFAVEDGQLCYLTPDGDIVTVRGDAEEDVEWSAETGTIFLQVRGSSGDAHYLRWITRLNMQLRMELGSRVTVEIQYDSKEPWLHVATVKAISLRSFSLPIRPRRCDHFRLRISGKGDVTLYSITKTLEEGSELP